MTVRRRNLLLAFALGALALPAVPARADLDVAHKISAAAETVQDKVNSATILVEAKEKVGAVKTFGGELKEKIDKAKAFVEEKKKKLAELQAKVYGTVAGAVSSATSKLKLPPFLKPASKGASVADLKASAQEYAKEMSVDYDAGDNMEIHKQNTDRHMELRRRLVADIYAGGFMLQREIAAEREDAKASEGQEEKLENASDIQAAILRQQHDTASRLPKIRNLEEMMFQLKLQGMFLNAQDEMKLHREDKAAQEEMEKR